MAGVFVEHPRIIGFRGDEGVAGGVVGVANSGIVFADSVVVGRANTALTAKLAVPGFGVNAFDQFGFVDSGNDFGNDVVFVEKCVMSHYQLTFPVPAWNSYTLLPPVV